MLWRFPTLNHLGIVNSCISLPFKKKLMFSPANNPCSEAGFFHKRSKSESLKLIDLKILGWKSIIWKMKLTIFQTTTSIQKSSIQKSPTHPIKLLRRLHAQKFSSCLGSPNASPSPQITNWPFNSQGTCEIPPARRFGVLFFPRSWSVRNILEPHKKHEKLRKFANLRVKNARDENPLTFYTRDEDPLTRRLEPWKKWRMERESSGMTISFDGRVGLKHKHKL